MAIVQLDAQQTQLFHHMLQKIIHYHQDTPDWGPLYQIKEDLMVLKKNIDDHLHTFWTDQELQRDFSLNRYDREYKSSILFANWFNDMNNFYQIAIPLQIEYNRWYIFHKILTPEQDEILSEKYPDWLEEALAPLWEEQDERVREFDMRREPYTGSIHMFDYTHLGKECRDGLFEKCQKEIGVK